MYEGDIGTSQGQDICLREDEAMDKHKLLMELDNLLAVMEDDAEKGKYQSYHLWDKLAAEKSTAQKLYSYDDCRIMSRIAFDYADKVEDGMAKAREVFNALFDVLKE